MLADTPAVTADFGAHEQWPLGVVIARDAIPGTVPPVDVPEVSAARQWGLPQAAAQPSAPSKTQPL